MTTTTLAQRAYQAPRRAHAFVHEYHDGEGCLWEVVMDGQTYGTTRDRAVLDHLAHLLDADLYWITDAAL